MPDTSSDIELEDVISAAFLGPMFARAAWASIESATVEFDAEDHVRRFLFGCGRR